MKLNLGCGNHVPDSWVNVDYALGARLVKIPFFRAFNKKTALFNIEWNAKIYPHDLRKRFPWPDCSASIIYTSHALEHFSKSDGQRFLVECHRVLHSDGIIRIVVPDLRHEVYEYIEGRTKAYDFVEKMGVLYVNSTNLKTRLSPFFQFPHKCMYDNSCLQEVLGEIGFATSTRAAFDSDIVDIQVIEQAIRTENAVIVEGRKL
jgi:SAM-dependent methyltransferase